MLGLGAKLRVKTSWRSFAPWICIPGRDTQLELRARAMRRDCLPRRPSEAYEYISPVPEPPISARAYWRWRMK